MVDWDWVGGDMMVVNGADASGSNEYTCTEGGINNLFGCANPESDSWIITDSTQTINCGPFGM